MGQYGLGDCFSAAFEAAAHFDKLGARVMIVHGRPVYRGKPDGVVEAGDRFWHAWAEVQGEDGWLVADWSNGKTGKQFPRTAYYKGGELKLSMVQRYELDDALALANEQGQYGPWEGDEEDLP